MMAYKIPRKKTKVKKIVNQDTFELKKGSIQDFQGSWGSGMGVLIIKRDDGVIDRVPVENAPTIRSLDSAYGGVIREGHTASVKHIKGKKIYYGMTDWGTMSGFMPIEEASPELEMKYLKQFKKRK